MEAPKASIVLVTPVWNDSSRLDGFGTMLAEALALSNLPIHWVIADDGSSSAEKATLEELTARFSQRFSSVELMSFTERSRKGGAIYQAWDAYPEAEWLAFVDADGAIGADKMMELIRCAIDNQSACVGVRRHSSGAPVRRKLGRAISFRLFHGMVSILLGVRFSDTQCGAKVIPAATYFQIADRLSERGYIFDVELLLAVGKQDCAILEKPVPWREIPGGKVSPLRDAWRMLAGLLRIRKRLKAGQY